MAREIAKQLKELEYPGQIKVTVIRNESNRILDCPRPGDLRPFQH